MSDKTIDDFLYALEDLDRIIGHATGANEGPEEMSDDTITQIDDDQPTVADAEIMDSAHVQIRVWKSGPRDADGRHGDIILEDLSAPIEVARWLASPQCRKVTGARKRVYVWIDDTLVSNADALPIPADDDPVRSQVPAVRAHDSQAIEILQAYQGRLRSEIAALEKDLEETKARCAEEAKQARAMRDLEVNASLNAVLKARERLEAELGREERELEDLDRRRKILSEQRESLASSIKTDADIYTALRDRLTDMRGQSETFGDKLAALGDVIEKNPVVGTVLEGIAGKALSMFADKKPPT